MSTTKMMEESDHQISTTASPFNEGARGRDNQISTGPSVLQGEDMLYSSKILARQSTVGGSCSSRIYYRASEGVPFQWEKQPGKPISSRLEDALPPLSPPPAMLALSMPKPNIVITDDEPKARRWSRAWLVKKLKRRIEFRKALWLAWSKNTSDDGPDTNQAKIGSERYASARFSSSSFASTSRSSSACNSSSEKPSSEDVPCEDLSPEKAITCTPRGFNSVLYFDRKT